MYKLSSISRYNVHADKHCPEVEASVTRSPALGFAWPSQLYSGCGNLSAYRRSANSLGTGVGVVRLSTASGATAPREVVTQPGRKAKHDPFGHLLARKIAEAGLNDTEVAEAVGVSKGTISQLKAGVLQPSQKLVPAIAWALNRTPSTLFDEISLFLQASGRIPDCCSTVEEIGRIAKAIWVVMPRYIAEDVHVTDEIRKLVTILAKPVVLFVTPERAKALRDQPWAKTSNISIKTPHETLLNLEYPLLFVDPTEVHECQLFRLIFTPSGLLPAKIRPSHWSTFLISGLSYENHLVNIAELAAIEQKQPAELVILYTHEFPEQEEDLLFEAVKRNIKENGKRYLYLFPGLGKVETARARITYNKLKTKLRNHGVEVTDWNFNLIDADAGHRQLFRDGTFVLYAGANVDNDPEPVTLYKQVEGTCPTRFQEVDTENTAQFYATLIEPLQDKIRKWIGRIGDGRGREA